MDPDQIVEDPLMAEAAILQFFKNNFTTNPKKLVKLAWRVRPHCAEYVIKGLLNTIVKSKDPVGYLQKCFQDIDDLVKLIPELVAEGFHGMIMVNDVIYPLTLDTRDNWLKERWSEDDELEILERLAVQWMRLYDQTYFQGKVVLWPAFGFSGIPTDIVLRRDWNTDRFEPISVTAMAARKNPTMRMYENLMDMVKQDLNAPLISDRLSEKQSK
jgi:hypothetical protein